MEKVVVDSDILIDFFRASKGFFPQLLYLQEEGKIELYISSITVFELFSGSSSRREEKLLMETISNFRVIAFDGEIAKLAGEKRRDEKLTNPIADFIIGITSIYLQAEIATRNKDHFKGIKGINFFKL
ncbi:hypothetical protein A2773_07095 [Candidatus Gottesmanbacteria bacterium RIFCSPHIGHO2_01_FULL_39_10]|uniref:PIN domain-containing protein n=1 Tax=Candidatus Gottesmanbacteria bacterium RIFCSPHIGHO2_01_FULL_39_10 TaxID=1798375 RepID=A0A1F5ZRV6_9BACT|nr:MAG: hypothetical protein A2773_07095 [Candidatus Gottesmanbacteria bacterium RIFCSPHIGHO2_01_FULL_39_10]